MKTVRRVLFRLLAIAALSAAFLPVEGSLAQTNYPTRPVRIVVPFAPGGATDYIASFMAQQLSQRVGR